MSDLRTAKNIETPYKVILVGGGSGGHITPLLAVATALKELSNSVDIIYIGQKGEGLQEVVTQSVFDAHHSISAGKFRRYHSTSIIAQLFDIKTIALNVRDFFRFLYGFVESIALLKRTRPDVILLKGGFVCVPVGFAARLLRIPYITHDSDAIPGLANRLTSTHSHLSLTAMPVHHYPYPSHKTRQVGIPLRKEFQYVTPQMQAAAKKKYAIPLKATVLLVVGGGLGAQRINGAIASISAVLLKSYPDLYIVHITGKKLFKETEALYHAQIAHGELSQRVQLIDFTTDIVTVSAASDLVVTRAGATNIAEFALQGKACIVIPSPYLTGGQQLHNAKILENLQAAVIVQEKNMTTLSTTITGLLDNVAARELLARKLHDLAVTDSAHQIASLLLEAAKSSSHMEAHLVVPEKE